jgi:putative redox protein
MGTVTLRTVEGTMMVGTDSRGHSVVIGRSPDDRSVFLGLKASDLLLLSAAACSAYDVVEILSKQRQPMRDLKVLCTGEQQADPPYTFTNIHLHYIAYGEVNSEKLAKAISLSQDKYCSVISTLRPGVPISSDFEVES